LTVDWLSSNMKEKSGICGALIFFCMTINIRFHNTPLNGVRIFSYVQTKKDGRKKHILISATERKQSAILLLESQKPYTGTHLPFASLISSLNLP